MNDTGMSSRPQPLPDRAAVRTMKIVVIVLGVMLVLGVLSLIGRIVYLASQPSRQAANAPGSARVSGAARLVLPVSAHIRQISLSADRLAVHYEGPAGGGIAILDVASGAVLSRIEIVPEVPR